MVWTERLCAHSWTNIALAPLNYPRAGEFSLLISETLDLFASIRVFHGVLPTGALVSIRVHSWLLGG
jgi:hypothetical protein